MSENQQASQFQNRTEPDIGNQRVQPEEPVSGSVKSLITNKQSEISVDKVEMYLEFKICLSYYSLIMNESPRYGPVCQVVWEERGREASPYPD